MEKSQREYYLNEQVKAIQKELGEQDEGADLDELEEKIKTVGMTKEAKEKCFSEFKKLKMMSPMSAEALWSVIILIGCYPFHGRKTEINKDLKKCRNRS